MHIAILDDDRDEIYRIREMIFNIQGDYRVDEFLEGKKLLEAVESSETYDLLLCDVYMRDENGIEIARKVLQTAPMTPVAFITVSSEHAVDAFAINAIHYLVKPVCQEDIVEIFRRLDSKTEPRHTLTIRIGRMINVLYQDEILRVEAHGHNTVITCANGSVYSIRKPFREINEMLDETFIQIKKGVTVNMSSISRMTYRNCVTKDGFTYLLRRDQAQEIRERYLMFLKKELNHG